MWLSTAKSLTKGERTVLFKALFFLCLKSVMKNILRLCCANDRRFFLI